MTMTHSGDGAAQAIGKYRGADRAAAATAGPGLSPVLRPAAAPVRGEGRVAVRRQGKPYLDAYNNVVPLGHCHRAVVEAIARQASTLNTHTRYVHETVLDYAEALLATYTPGPGHVMFTCTGSEANDLALRIAQAHTGATGDRHAPRLSRRDAVDRRTSPSLGRYVTLGPAVRTVAAPDSYRQAPGETGPALARAVREAIADLARHGLRPAALMVDTIFQRRRGRTGGLSARSRGRDPRSRRPVHRRRGAGRHGAHRRDAVGLYAAWRGAGPDHHGQAAGQWPSRGRRGGQAASAGGFRPQQPLLQHLWRQSGIGGGRPGRVAHGAAGRADAERGARRRLSARAPARIGRAS